jgi:hypothetical protein
VHAATGVIQTYPLNSLLLLVNLGGVPYTLENVAVLRRATVANAPYVKARAVIGLPAIADLSFQAVARISGTRMRSFPDRESALDWLVAQA